MNTEELEQTTEEGENRNTAILFAVGTGYQNGSSETLFSSSKTDLNQRKQRFFPEFCFLTSLGTSSDRENSGFSIFTKNIGDE